MYAYADVDIITSRTTTVNAHYDSTCHVLVLGTQNLLVLGTHGVLYDSTCHVLPWGPRTESDS